MLAGTIMAFFAAVTAALAFFVIGYIPKSEPSLVIAIWFHAASLASSTPFLAVITPLAMIKQLFYVPPGVPPIMGCAKHCGW